MRPTFRSTLVTGVVVAAVSMGIPQVSGQGVFDGGKSSETTGGVVEPFSSQDEGSRTLPELNFEHTLEDMKVGETAYTLPWGMWADTKDRGWLHPEYPADARPAGTVTLRVERREDGYHVWPEGERFSKYPVGKHPEFNGDAVDMEYIPIVGVHTK